MPPSRTGKSRCFSVKVGEGQWRAASWSKPGTASIQWLAKANAETASSDWNGVAFFLQRRHLPFRCKIGSFSRKRPDEKRANLPPSGSIQTTWRSQQLQNQLLLFDLSAVVGQTPPWPPETMATIWPWWQLWKTCLQTHTSRQKMHSWRAESYSNVKKGRTCHHEWNLTFALFILFFLNNLGCQSQTGNWTVLLTFYSSSFSFPKIRFQDTPL